MKQNESPKTIGFGVPVTAALLISIVLAALSYRSTPKEFLIGLNISGSAGTIAMGTTLAFTELRGGMPLMLAYYHVLLFLVR